MKLSNLNAQIYLFDRVNLVDKLTFTKHLSLMIKSGISLPEAVSILQVQTVRPSLKKVLEQLEKDLSNGLQLNKALARFPKIFDSFYINLIEAAEESGTLEQNLDYLAVHLKKEREFSNKVRQALLYPSIVLSLSFILAMGLSIFVLPKLIDLFASLDVPLPLSTRILLGFAAIMRDYGIFITLGIIGLVVLWRFLIKTKYVKPYWDWLILAVPIFGPLQQKIELAGLLRNLGMMLHVGVPISTALDIQAETTPNTIYKKYLAVIKNNVKKGQGIGDTLSSKPHPFMPLIVLRMIGVGEKTGRLDETLLYLGDFFEEEVDDATKNLSTIIEPLILVGVGLVVGFIAISIIGPIYQFTGSIGA